jgi:general secretion pathway protein L
VIIAPATAQQGKHMVSFTSAFRNRQLFEGEIGAAARRALAWYSAEFCACFSKETIAWMFDRGDCKLLLRASDPAKALHFVERERDQPAPVILPAELLGGSLEAALLARGVSRDAANIFLEVPRSAFFIRRFDIPAAAEANLPQLLQADIERKTPFRAGDVVHGHVLSRRGDAPGKLSVQLWILRRDIVNRALEGTGLAWSDLDAVVPEGEGDREETPTIALGRHGEAPHWFRNAAIGLGVAAVALFALGSAILAFRQDAAEKELDSKIAEVSQRANTVRRIADEAVAQSRLLKILREERNHGPTFADLWEEVSRVLPDGAYLTELRLSEARAGERALDLVGFADSAVGLPALFDKSPLFSEASLTAPITPNAQEKREAFSLRANVKQKLFEEAK